MNRNHLTGNETKYFGPDWHPHFDSVPIPIGEECTWCGEPIREDDQGFITAGSPRMFHEVCFLRQIIGSVGHIRKRCNCYGRCEGDPPGMTLRQAARAAVSLYNSITFGD